MTNSEFKIKLEKRTVGKGGSDMSYSTTLTPLVSDPPH